MVKLVVSIHRRMTMRLFITLFFAKRMLWLWNWASSGLDLHFPCLSSFFVWISIHANLSNVLNVHVLQKCIILLHQVLLEGRKFAWVCFQFYLFPPAWCEHLAQIIDVFLVVALSAPFFCYLAGTSCKLANKFLNWKFVWGGIFAIGIFLGIGVFFTHMGFRYLASDAFARKVGKLKNSVSS